MTEDELGVSLRPSVSSLRAHDAPCRDCVALLETNPSDRMGVDMGLALKVWSTAGTVGDSLVVIRGDKAVAISCTAPMRPLLALSWTCPGADALVSDAGVSVGLIVSVAGPL